MTLHRSSADAASDRSLSPTPNPAAFRRPFPGFRFALLALAVWLPCSPAVAEPVEPTAAEPATPATPNPPAAPAEEWRALEKLRAELASASPLGADFTQSFVPAGFESGDSESGSVALGLPDCLRWDYAQPDAKSFLVCGAKAWSWVEGEPRGRRATIDADDERGLDLLLLPTVELANRYRLTMSRTSDGGSELAFEPLGEGSELAAANLVLDSSGGRPVALDWRDREGSVTSFRFRSWHPLPSTDLFSPPAALEWSEPSDSADSADSGRSDNP